MRVQFLSTSSSMCVAITIVVPLLCIWVMRLHTSSAAIVSRSAVGSSNIKNAGWWMIAHAMSSLFCCAAERFCAGVSLSFCKSTNFITAPVLSVISMPRSP